MRVLTCSSRVKNSHIYALLAFIFAKVFFSTWRQRSSSHHVFLTRTFFYPAYSATSDQRLFSREQRRRSGFVSLVNAQEEFEAASLRAHPLCIIHLPGEKVRLRVAEIVKFHDPDSECRLVTYKISCDYAVSDSVRVDSATPRLQLKLGNCPPVEVPVRRADSIKRTLVVCPGRMFLFEQWHLLLTSIELLRAIHVDLVVVYVQSVDEHIYTLLEHYQRDGIVAVRGSLAMPADIAPILGFNPNAETTWNNQLVNFHDALHEFRESAAFMVFPDWDEFIVTVGSRPLPSLLQELDREQPHVGAFIYQRIGGDILKLEEMSADNLSITDVWSRAIYIRPDIVFPTGKVLIRPKHVVGLSIHKPIAVAAEYNEATLSRNISYMVHVRNRLWRDGSALLAVEPTMVDNFQRFIRKHDLQELMEKLPLRESMLAELNDCLGRPESGWDYIRTHAMFGITSKCYNFHQCLFEPVKKRCVNVHNRWSTTATKYQYRTPIRIEMALHFLVDSSLLASNECTI